MATYIEVEQVKETKSFILSRPTWLWGGEMGVNECGVCIGNEAVFTKGRYGKTALTGMDILRLALERSEDAKQAVDCIIGLLEQYGQGGNCGYDSNFIYDNSFLIMDRSSLYILDTAGKEWAYRKTKAASISNRLSIASGGDAYSGEVCDFDHKHSDFLYSYFSASEKRSLLTRKALENADTIEAMLAILRLHNSDKNPLCRASVSSPCMHAGGLIGDHTTQSMAAELKSDGSTLLWLTGSSMPCVSIFKPFLFGDSPISPVYKAGDERCADYWLSSERFKRTLIGKQLPAEYYTERDEIEKELLEKSKSSSAKDLHELSEYAISREAEFVGKWSSQSLKKGSCGVYFNAYWSKKNNLLGK